MSTRNARRKKRLAAQKAQRQAPVHFSTVYNLIKTKTKKLDFPVSFVRWVKASAQGVVPWLRSRLQWAAESYSRGGLAVAVVVILYLLYAFTKTATCDQGILGCGINGFGVVFPLYVLVMNFMGRLDMLTFISFFSLCSTFYIYSSYHIGALAEQFVRKIHARYRLYTLTAKH